MQELTAMLVYKSQSPQAVCLFLYNFQCPPVIFCCTNVQCFNCNDLGETNLFLSGHRNSVIFFQRVFTVVFTFWQTIKVREGNGTPLQYSCLENPMDGGAWKAAVHGVAEGQTRLSDFSFTFHFPALEKEMATHSSVLAWRILGTGEPGGLPSMGSHRVRHD